MPKIHSELELVYAFIIKLRPDISKDLISRDFHTFKTLQPLIAAAQRYESHAVRAAQPHDDNIELWQPKPKPTSNHNKGPTQAANILYTDGQYQGSNSRTLPLNPTQDKSIKLHSSGPHSHRPKPDVKFGCKSKLGSQPKSGDPTHQICFHFNRNVRSGCEMPNNLCRNRQHLCLTCNQWGCKQLNHPPQPHSNNFSQSSFKPPGTEAQVTAPPPPNSNGDSCDLKQILTDMKSAIQSDIHAVKSDMQSITSHIEKIEVLPQSALASKSYAPQDILTKAPQFGNPAITAVPSHLDISDLDLVNKNVLWTRITSAGIPLPLPLDSCCSLSLVSQAHADVICKIHPAMKFTKLSTPLPVSVANPQAQLQAIGTLQVPIIWGNGRPSIFSMLVVPNLAWPMLFGQNHLRMIEAHTDHARSRVRFDHPSLKFTCCDENPLVAFPSLAKQYTSSTNGIANSVQSDVHSPTCLLTPMPPPTQPREHVTFNVVSFCLLLASSLVGSFLLAGPM